MACSHFFISSIVAMKSSINVVCYAWAAILKYIKHWQVVPKWLYLITSQLQCTRFSYSQKNFTKMLSCQSFKNSCVGFFFFSPCSPRDSQESSPTPLFKSINSSALNVLHSPTHIHTWPQEKTIALTRRTFAGKQISLLFNVLSRLVGTFLPRSKWLNFIVKQPDVSQL